ncbi:nonribosomal peptide synthase [Aspergillus niger]|nr:nonribosomal peptide synthase [Aspergillus niger]
MAGQEKFPHPPLIHSPRSNGCEPWLRHSQDYETELGVNNDDFKWLMALNGTSPEPSLLRVHDLIEAQMRKNPSALAIDAWDGRFTYQELDNISSCLADDLYNRGVGPETCVLVHLDKSCWTPVAILGIIRAGGAFTLLDSSHRFARWKEISEAVGARIIITSRQKNDQANLIAETTVLVDELLLKAAEPCPQQWRGSTVTPTSLLYVVFTSGSTGKPKGVMVEHGALCATAQATAEQVGIGPGVRILQFASYAFDANVFDHLRTLICGACLCIPSTTEVRDDLAKAMTAMAVTATTLTPSVTRLFQPEEVPTLRHLIVGGERLSDMDRKRWCHQVRLTNEYGPAECAVACISRPDVSSQSSAHNVGSPRGCVCWIVDPNNHDRLLPIGMTGELCIEGPALARGYLNDPQRTQLSFIENPAWMHHFRGNSTSRRIYKTGDLARYEADGTVEIQGRKDRQVKLRGQRVELGEVEHHVRKYFPNGKMIIVELITPANATTPILIAFIWHPKKEKEHSNEVVLAPFDEDFCAKVQAAKAQLESTLPSMLIPSAFLNVFHIPLAATGKLDVQKLRDEVSRLTFRDISAYSTAMHEKVEPFNTEQKCLQKIWAKALVVPPDSIGINDSFFEIGGDSLLAMAAAREARSEGLLVGVADILRYRTIEQLVGHLDFETRNPASTGLSQVVTGLNLIRDQCLVQRISSQTKGAIEDILPCFPVQQGILISEAKTPHSYQNRILWEVQSKNPLVPPDITKLQAAWNHLVNRHSMLRTAFVYYDTGDEGGYLQVQFRPCAISIPIQAIDNAPTIENHVIKSRTHESQLQPPWNVVLYTLPDGRLFCDLEISHTLIDGVSLSILVRELQSFYDGTFESPSTSIFLFRKYYQKISSLPRQPMLQYWTSYLDGVNPCIFPTGHLKKAHKNSRPILRTPPVRLNLPTKIISSLKAHGVTLFNLIQVAWGLTLRSYTGSDSVCFGYLSSGRDEDVDGIADAIGPFITMLICRMNLNSESPVIQILRGAHDDFVQSFPHQHCPLSDIIHSLGMSGQQPLFNTIVTFEQNPNIESEQVPISLTVLDEHEPTEFPLVLHVDTTNGSVYSHITYWASALSETAASSTLRMFNHIFGEIGANIDGSIGNVNILNAEDQARIFARNAVVPPRVDSCVHDLVRRSVSIRPHQPAVCGFDGQFTYTELWQKASRLSLSLIELGVVPGAMVPICFPRSVWTIVCMLATLQAGAACVPVECDHPPERIRATIQELEPPVILCNSETQSLVEQLRLPSKIWTFTPDLLCESNMFLCRPEDARPSDPAFLLFTSGSTGTPKGIMMDHGALSSAMIYHGSACKMGPETRALQFSSYAFDVSIYEIFTTLVHGGCVCVPSVSQRSNSLAQAIKAYQANWAFLTPSVLRILKPQEVPSLDVVVAGGEAVSQDIVEAWVDHVHLLNGYGPAECSICTVYHFSDKGESSTIGHMTGAVGWVVDPDNINRLVPDGTIGELLVEGPVVSSGYINRPHDTAAAFLDPPRWLQDFRHGHYSRLFKTGDLVRHNDEGLLEFVRRKTNQVKIRGQRVELEDIEVNIRRLLPTSEDVVVSIVKPGASQMISAFICRRDATKKDQCLILPSSKSTQEGYSVLRTRLQEILPRYMIPDVFLPVSHIPLTRTGKVDRRLLMRLGSQLSRSELECYRGRKPPSLHRQYPETEMQRILQALYAQTLSIDPEDVSMHDHFFYLGGDSISAMRLVATARARGLDLSVSRIFQHPILCDLASLTGTSTDPDPMFEVSSDTFVSLRSAFLNSPLTQGLPLDTTHISEVLPTTYFQSIMATQPANYWVMRFPSPVNVARMREAFEVLLDFHPMLRSYFVLHRGQTVQVIFRSVPAPFTQLDVNEDGSLQSQINSLDRGPEDFPLVRCLVTGTASMTRDVIIRLSRAQHDRLCLPKIIEDLLTLYQGSIPAKPISFSAFLSKSTDHTKESEFFWKQELEGALMTSLSPRRELTHKPSPIRAHRVIPNVRLPIGITMATTIKTAWSLVLSRWTGQQDVVFGQIVSGRSALPVAEPQHIIGPCINITPVYISVSPHHSFHDISRLVHDQHIRALPHETLDFNLICRAVNWHEETVFGSVVDHVGSRDSLDVSINGLECQAHRFSPDQCGGLSTQMWVVSEQYDDDLYLTIESTEEFLSTQQGNQLIDQLRDILEAVLVQHGDSGLCTI